MKRIRYYDLLRVVCFSFIVFYHMAIQLSLSGIFPVEIVSPFYSNTNMHIATLAVAVFFMLSGASLAYTTKDNFRLLDFYKKRFLRLLIPFYLVVLLSYLVLAVLGPGFSGLFPAGLPWWKFIFTVLGIDEWLSMHGIATFSRGIGEWFLGALLILYLLFPLLRFLMRKNRRVFFTIATCIYLIVIYNYASGIPVFMNLWVKGYEFVIGMLFGCYYQEFSPKWMMLSVPVSVFFFTSSTTLFLNEALKITIFAVAFFVSFSYLENTLGRCSFRLVSTLSKYSYELFLIHHMVIYYVTPRVAGYITNTFTTVVLFIVQLAIMAVLAFLIKLVSDRILRLIP